MRSRASCFNRAFSRSLLRRFWPLWALWLALLLTVGLGNPLGTPPEAYASRAVYLSQLNRVLLETGVILVNCAAAAAPLMVMAMLGYLYSPRACGMVNALPMRRGEAYLTAALTGLAPMLAADVLAYLLLLVRFGGIEGVDAGHIHTWFALVAMGNVAFYGMACFCGVLTGNAVVVPLVYFVLGVAALVVENASRELLGMLVYGYAWENERFAWLAPLAGLFNELEISAVRDFAGQEAAVYTVRGLPYLAWLCAAGIALLLLGVPILRRRHMETAGDVVAVPVLRPIFRVCMAVGTGLVLAVFGCDAFFGSRPAAPAVFLLLILGAALGFFAARMLLMKTLRVFSQGWLQLGVICVCLVLPFLLAELDVTGYETRVPDPAAVESVSMSYGRGITVEEPESVAAFCDFHRGLIAHKAANESARRRAYTMLPLNYTMKDGTRFTRLYRIPSDEAAQTDPGSDLAAYQAICNLPECILLRAGAARVITPDTVRSATLTVEHRVGPRRQADTISLTPAQAVSLCEQGILPDAQAGAIGRWYVWESALTLEEQSNVTFDLELADDRTPIYVAAPGLYSGTLNYNPEAMISLNVLTCSAHTVRWLEENLALTPVSRAALSEP